MSETGSKNVEHEVARAIADAGAVLINTSNWRQLSSGAWSPVFIDGGRLMGSPYQWGVVLGHMADFLSDHQFAGVCGVPEGGRDHAAAIASRLGVQCVSIHPKNNELIGANKGDHVVVIEDVISTGGSAYDKAVVPLRVRGLVVDKVFAIVSHGIEPDRRLASGGVAVFSLCRSRAVIEMELNRISYTPEIKATVRRWLDDPLVASHRYVSGRNLSEARMGEGG